MSRITREGGFFEAGSWLLFKVIHLNQIESNPMLAPMDVLNEIFRIISDEKIKVLADCSFELEILDGPLHRTLFANI